MATSKFNAAREVAEALEMDAALDALAERQLYRELAFEDAYEEYQNSLEWGYQYESQRYAPDSSDVTWLMAPRDDVDPEVDPF